MTLWTAADIIAATGASGSSGWRANGVSIDTRTLAPGDLFVALKGPRYDGHDFVSDAFSVGAAAALVSQGGTMPEGPVLRVDDTLQALGDLGRAARQRTGARIVAVTGSVGKTGAVRALTSALEVQGATHASAQSYNNHWGVPLSLARMAPESEYGLFEIGMNHAGEIEPLARMVSPHVALITNVEAAHLAAFDTMTDLAAAKAEIFTGLEPGGVAVLNRDSEHFMQLRTAAQVAGAARILTFSAVSNADVRLLKMRLHEDCSCVTADVDGQPVTYKLGAPGRHLVMNSLAWLACLKALKADLALAALQWAGLRGLAGRGIRYVVDGPGGRFILVDESHNANPASMMAALETLGQSHVSGRGRRIAILGDMLELGAAADDWHRQLAPAIKRAGIRLVFTCGQRMKQLYEVLPSHYRGGHGSDAAALAPMVLEAVGEGDVVMVKGSHGSSMSIVVQSLRALEEGALSRPGHMKSEAPASETVVKGRA